jgi:hypothetical protein
MRLAAVIERGACAAGFFPVYSFSAALQHYYYSRTDSLSEFRTGRIGSGLWSRLCLRPPVASYLRRHRKKNATLASLIEISYPFSWRYLRGFFSVKRNSAGRLSSAVLILGGWGFSSGKGIEHSAA